MDRLHQQDLILNPASKAKSVVLTEEGYQRSREAFYQLFGRREKDELSPGQ